MTGLSQSQLVSADVLYNGIHSIVLTDDILLEFIRHLTEELCPVLIQSCHLDTNNVTNGLKDVLFCCIDSGIDFLTYFLELLIVLIKFLVEFITLLIVILCHCLCQTITEFLSFFIQFDKSLINGSVLIGNTGTNLIKHLLCLTREHSVLDILISIVADNGTHILWEGHIIITLIEVNVIIQDFSGFILGQFCEFDNSKVIKDSLEHILNRLVLISGCCGNDFQVVILNGLHQHIHK